MHFSLKVEFLAGTDIKDAIREAAEFAKKLGVAYVMFDFNGVSMSVSKDADIEETAMEYQMFSNKATKQYVISK